MWGESREEMFFEQLSSDKDSVYFPNLANLNILQNKRFVFISRKQAAQHLASGTLQSGLDQVYLFRLVELFSRKRI